MDLVFSVLLLPLLEEVWLPGAPRAAQAGTQVIPPRTKHHYRRYHIRYFTLPITCICVA